MKYFLLISAFIICLAAGDDQQLTWNNNLEKAVDLSNSGKKPIMMFFTGSDWCGWCKRLQSEVFNQPEFVTWAKKNVVLMEVDFPRRTPLAPELQEQNNKLQQFFQVQGYPTVFFVNVTKKDGSLSFENLGSTGYLAGGPKVWLETANGILKKK